MFNVAVLKMKDIIKYLVGFTVTIFIVVTSARYFSFLKNSDETNKLNVQDLVEKITDSSFSKCIGETMAAASVLNEEYEQVAQENDEEEFDYLHTFLKTEISSIKGIEELEKKQNEEQIAEEKEQENEKQEEVKLAQTELPTEVVTNQPIAESFNTQYGTVKIKNQTSYTLTEEIMNPDITIENKNVLLFHTHSCESYTSSELYPYTPTGNFRTTDLNFTVTRVGTELDTQLKQYGYTVFHDTSYHDYPAYNGSYTRSLATVENALKTNPCDIIIDIHRDAIGSRSDYAPTVKIGEEYAAQIMYVIGTNGGGLYHPNWQQNLKFAIMVQQKAEEMYPGLFKPIMLTNSRYNQHTGKFASIIEVGATGNTLEQCLVSMKYLAKVLDEVL